MATELYVIHPGAGLNRTSDGASYRKQDGTNISYGEQRFAKADRTCFFHGIAVPPDLDTGGNVTIRTLWRQVDAGASADLYINVSYLNITPPTDRDDSALTGIGAQTVTLTGTVGEEVARTFTLAASGLTAGEELLLSVSRIGTNGSDTFGGTASLVSIEVRFPQSLVSSATLQDAYDSGNAILTASSNPVSITDHSTTGALSITSANNAATGSAIGITSTAALLNGAVQKLSMNGTYTVTPGAVEVTYAGGSINSGTDTEALKLIGVTNAGAGISTGVTITGFDRALELKTGNALLRDDLAVDFGTSAPTSISYISGSTALRSSSAAVTGANASASITSVTGAVTSGTTGATGAIALTTGAVDAGSGDTGAITLTTGVNSGSGGRGDVTTTCGHFDVTATQANDGGSTIQTTGDGHSLTLQTTGATAPISVYVTDGDFDLDAANGNINIGLATSPVSVNILGRGSGVNVSTANAVSGPTGNQVYVTGNETSGSGTSGSMTWDTGSASGGTSGSFTFTTSTTASVRGGFQVNSRTIDLNGTGAITIDATDTSNFTTSSGGITVEGNSLLNLFSAGAGTSVFIEAGTAANRGSVYIGTSADTTINNLTIFDGNDTNLAAELILHDGAGNPYVFWVDASGNLRKEQAITKTSDVSGVIV